MALRAALKDRARIVRLEVQAQRVEGRSLFVPVNRPEFRCRLEVKRVPKSRDDAGVMSFNSVPVLLCDRRDEGHEDLEFEVDDKIEVTSRDMPQFSGLYNVDSLPEPIRKKRKVIGWLLTLSATSQSDFQRAAA